MEFNDSDIEATILPFARREKPEPPDEEPELVIRLQGEAAKFVREYAHKNGLDTAKEVQRRALGLLALETEMTPDETLGVINKREHTVDAVELPWRQPPRRRRLRWHK